MGIDDVILDYGLGVVVVLASGLGVLIAYHVGYSFGHQDGFRDGIHRGSRFGRLKVHEQETNNN